jgi:formylglycine-generating enzyme required for sulfatase activity
MNEEQRGEKAMRHAIGWCVILTALAVSAMAEPALEWAPTPQGPWTTDPNALVVDLLDGTFDVRVAVIEDAQFFRLVDNGTEVAHCPLDIRCSEIQIKFLAGDLDSDQDGVPDCEDVCPGFDDTADEDGDGIPDGCDIPNELTVWLPGGIPLVLIEIHGGTFEMGSPDTELSHDSLEAPVHTVTIDYDFYMGKYELTQAQWWALMQYWPISRTYGASDDLPVYGVSWNDAKDFIAALNNHIGATGQGPLTVRLPSEAEWEYSCRAGTQTRFFFGDSLGAGEYCDDDGIRSQYMWFCGDGSPSGAKEVGTKLPNAFGLYDMPGSIWEWCEDTRHNNYIGAPDDGSAWVSSSAGDRIYRGGFWGSNARTGRSALRNYYSPTIRNFTFGMRIAATR